MDLKDLLQKQGMNTPELLEKEGIKPEHILLRLDIYFDKNNQNCLPVLGINPFVKDVLTQEDIIMFLEKAVDSVKLGEVDSLENIKA